MNIGCADPINKSLIIAKPLLTGDKQTC